VSAERVGIVTVAYYSAGVIGDFLDSIDDTVDVEIVIVDNTPVDDGLAARAAADHRVTLVRPGPNLGYGAGMNLGVATLPPDIRWIVLANPDLVMTPTTIPELLSGAHRLPRAGAFGPLIRNLDGTVYPSARKLPSLRTGIGHAIFIRVWPKNPWTTSYRNDLAAVNEHSVGWLSGAFLLVRREAFDAIGGFDERYFMYFEDVDLGRNLGLANWQSYYIPSAEVTHAGAASTNKVARDMILAHHESAYRYLAKRYRGWYLWPVRVVLRVALKARGRMAKG
jgi:N-acetylglucosaminyl-diphospho-decaprenol L-rhamnosyltransferase